MREQEVRHPKFVKVFSIGKTFEGRDLLVIKIGARKPYEKPAVFVEGGTFCALHDYREMRWSDITFSGIHARGSN